MRFKIIYIVFVFTCAVFLTLTPVFASQDLLIHGDQLNQLLMDIESNFSKIKTLRTKLKQEKSIPIFSEKILSKGFCIFKSPDRLRLEFTEPFKSSLIINGNQVFKYEFFDGSWHKLSTGNKEILLMIMGNITSWLKGRFNDQNLYKISALKNENVTIILIPKAYEFKKYITSFELGLNSTLDGLDHIIINEKKHTYTKIQFYNDEINIKIPDTLFYGRKDAPTPVLQW